MSTAPTVQYHILVSGRVQGVGFRYATVNEARRLGLAGWVRNTPDERVEILAQGHRDAVRELLAWCHRGPRGALVTDLTHAEQPSAEPLSGFRITY
ncbi:MAG: hypothetical protein A3J75_06100 [Acidobacteria bacterium RBG_16_68_9]|nr:MAG: hypothetical protein A3J75_06100 [Acidobacteria bacterium RBG_16_68_9]